MLDGGVIRHFPGERRPAVVPSRLPLLQREGLLLRVGVFLAAAHDSDRRVAPGVNPVVASQRILLLVRTTGGHDQVLPPKRHEDSGVREGFVVRRVVIEVARPAVVHSRGRKQAQRAGGVFVAGAGEEILVHPAAHNHLLEPRATGHLDGEEKGTLVQLTLNESS